MGLLTEGWVWMLTNDMSPAIRDMASSSEELAAYDGLMFISGLWNCKFYNRMHFFSPIADQHKENLGFFFSLALKLINMSDNSNWNS